MPLVFRSAVRLSLSLNTSSRSSRAAALTLRVTISCRSAGRRSKDFLLPRNQKPSHMWLVSEQNFCTSFSLAVAMMASGFSWPSTTLVCRAV